MTSITLFGGFRVPAAEGPNRMRVHPPDALDKIVQGYKYRSSVGWLDCVLNPEKAAKRIATIRRKAMFRPHKGRAKAGPVEKKEGILQRNNGGRRN